MHLAENLIHEAVWVEVPDRERFEIARIHRAGCGAIQTNVIRLRRT